MDQSQRLLGSRGSGCFGLSRYLDSPVPPRNRGDNFLGGPLLLRACVLSGMELQARIHAAGSLFDLPAGRDCLDLYRSFWGLCDLVSAEKTGRTCLSTSIATGAHQDTGTVCCTLAVQGKEIRSEDKLMKPQAPRLFLIMIVWSAMLYGLTLLRI